MRLTRLQNWMLRRLIRHILTTFQLPELMRVIVREHERIFYEDNRPTRAAHIRECLDVHL